MVSYPENIVIECAENCGNSPKKQLLLELNIALVKNEFEFCLSWMADHIVWDIVGQQRIEGITAFEKALHRMKDRKVRQLSIHNIITHGNTGAVNGTIVLNGNQTAEFCDVYNFSGFGRNAKIRSITSYVIIK